jgi:uncharacterized protein (TIGR03000 family)
MLRSLLVVFALLMLPLAATAQPGGRHPAGGGHSGIGGGVRPIGPVLLPSISPMPAISPPAAGLSGGIGSFGFGNANRRPGFPVIRPGLPFSPFGGFGAIYPYYGYGGYGGYGLGYGGYGYGGYGGYGLGYGSSSFYSPLQVPVYVPTGPAEPNVELSGKGNADLVLEFPAAAEVWVDGKKGEGDPHTEWTLSSPLLAIGTEYPFHVKARWTVNGKTYEYDKTVTVAAGNRSRSLVLSGTEIKE